MPPDPPARRRRRKPVRVAKYEVVRHLASGGMGAVYKALDTQLGREVALKILPPEVADSPVALERFRREAHHAARLRHENIVTVYDFDSSDGTWYLAMEFVEGIDLHEYISRKGRLDPEEARLITVQAARALDHAHKEGIVHRDVKPSNFLLTRKGDRLLVKLSDFGLALQAGDEEARVTRDGTTVGTVDYMSPEQGRDSRAADARSDIYSLGCTLFHMLTGQPPFPGGALTERLYRHAHEEAPDPRRFNRRVSEGMCAVVRRMLAKEPGERYQTPGALLKDLLRLESTAAPLGGRELLEGLAQAADEAPGPRSDPAASSGRRGAPASDPASSSQRRRAPEIRRRPLPPGVPQRRRDEAEAPVRTASPMGATMWVGVGIGVLLGLAILALLLVLRP
jgi:serine/threonine-protein kinase